LKQGSKNKNFIFEFREHKHFLIINLPFTVPFLCKVTSKVLC